MAPREPTDPPERHLTIRQSILRELEAGWASARDISQLVKIREKEVAQHLEHLEKSLRRSGKLFQMEPPECMACGFVYEDRKRHTKPSACPECRSQRIQPPRFRVVLENEKGSDPG